MKKTRIKYLTKSIRKNFISFFNVAFITAIGMAVLIGILSTSHAIELQTHKYFISNKFQTMEIKSANGITQDDMEALADRQDVDIAEGGYTAQVITASEKENLIIQAISLTEQLNLPMVVDGRLPEGTRELAVEQKYADVRGVQVGDVLTLEHDGCLYEDTFTVTGIINQPAYICVFGKEGRGSSTIGTGVVSHYVMMAPEAFDKDYYQDCYTVARVRNNDMDNYYYYSEEYTQQEDLLIADMEEFGKERSQIRYEELLEEAQPAIDAGLMDASEIEKKDWVISNREDSGDLVSVPILIETLNSISYSLALLFMVVVVVVCFSAISRMIDEQQNLIGMQKAQGFTTREILRHYMAYNVLCCIIGIAVGALLSVFFIEKLVLMVLNTKFLVGTCSLTFVWKEGLLIASIFLLVFILTTYLTCRKIVDKPVVDLMNSGKYAVQNKVFFFEKWKWYQNRRLYSRIMIKNVLGDKKRLITTIIGVLGSVTLMVMCFSLQMAIEGAFERQFEKYHFYENRLIIDTSTGKARDYEEILEAEGISHLLIQDKFQAYRIPGENWNGCHILTIDDDAPVTDFMNLEDIHTGETLAVPTDGILVSRKCAENYDLSAGSIVEVLDPDGTVQEMKVAGVMEHYLSFTYFVTSSSYYENVMGVVPDKSVFLLQGEITGLYDQVRGMEGFLSLRDNSEFEEDISIILIVIAICLILSAAMVFLVILNQIVMYINRRAIELAVMRINGYKISETKAYIYKDNIMLTIMGMICGSGFGLALSVIVIRILERDVHHYVRVPNPTSCLYAAAITAIFVLIVNLIGLRRIRHLNMTDVNSN